MKKILYLAMTGALMLGATGCIEDTLPTDFVLQEQIEASDDALAGMVGSIYTSMAGYSNDDGGLEEIGYSTMRLMLDSSTTALVCTGTQGYNTLAVWCYGAVSANGSNRGLYPSYLYYAYIKNVNDVIGMIPEDTDDPVRKAYLGIAHAYRALYYHDLVQIMEYKTPSPYPGMTYTEPEMPLKNLGVPIVTEKTPNDQLSHNPRATVDEVYDLILSDLKEAEGYLTGYNRTDKVQPDLSVVYGLYARVYTSLASRVKDAAKYTDETEYWKNAIKYADMAKQAGNYSYLTEDQWTDPKNGFNNRDSQNSWMLATSIAPGNEDAIYASSFNFEMLMGTETDFFPYGWRVGRSLNRKMYEQLSFSDFRKQSWLDPNFFYESTNQVEGEPYLVEKDEQGVLINNKWDDPQYRNDYSGFGPEKKQYKLSSNPQWIRDRITVGNGFIGLPWICVNIKFRPRNGVYNDWLEGGATDFPIMRVEEMDFIKAEAQYHVEGEGAAKATLQNLIMTRDSQYPATAVYPNDFMAELNFQKQIEFWGEGINYFDAKRQELGVHRKYLGTNVNTRSHCIEVDGVFSGWTPGWNQAERNANTMILHYNNPYSAPAPFYADVEQVWLNANFGAPIEF